MSQREHTNANYVQAASNNTTSPALTFTRIRKGDTA